MTDGTMGQRIARAAHAFERTRTGIVPKSVTVVQNEGTTFPPNFVWRFAEETEVFKPKELPRRNEVPEDKRIPGIRWMGYKSKYFLTALKPAGTDAIADGWVRGDESAFRFGLYEPAFELAPGGVHRAEYRLYLGPMVAIQRRPRWLPSQVPTLLSSRS